MRLAVCVLVCVFVYVYKYFVYFVCGCLLLLLFESVCVCGCVKNNNMTCLTVKFALIDFGKYASGEAIVCGIKTKNKINSKLSLANCG